jgi:hypothetical protein
VYYIVDKCNWAHSETLLKMNALIAVILIAVDQMIDRHSRLMDAEKCFILLYLAVCLLMAFRFTHIFPIFVMTVAVYGVYVHRVTHTTTE